MNRQKVAIDYVEQNASSKESEKVATARAAKVASLKKTLQAYEQNGKLIHAFYSCVTLPETRPKRMIVLKRSQQIPQSF